MGAALAGVVSAQQGQMLSPAFGTPPGCSDADIDLAAKAVLKGGFSYSGQRCTAVKLVLVQRDVADALAAKVRRGGDFGR